MTNLPLEIGNKIKFFRKKRGLTLVEFADILCKSKATVSKYENGQITIDIVTLYEIAEALGVHVEQLLYSEPAQVPKVPSFIFIIMMVVIILSTDVL